MWLLLTEQYTMVSLSIVRQANYYRLIVPLWHKETPMGTKTFTTLIKQQDFPVRREK